MTKAIAEAEAEGTMHEMEDDEMPTGHGIRTPSVDGLQVTPADGFARLVVVEGREARSSRAEEIQRGKQPMTPN